MTIAITGATGFIGSHTAARLLDRGHGVRALTRGGKALPAGVEAVPGDLVSASDEALAAFCDGADVLVHAAGEIRDEARMEALHLETLLAEISRSHSSAPSPGLLDKVLDATLAALSAEPLGPPLSATLRRQFQGLVIYRQ